MLPVLLKRGGGTEICYPLEVWHYNYIETLGVNRDVTFVDTRGSDDYKLVTTPADRNALLFYWSAEPIEPAKSFQPSADIQFVATAVQTALKSKVSRKLVESPINRDGPRFVYHADSLRATGYTSIVPISVRISDQGLSFQDDEQQQTARANLLVMISTIDGRVVETFEVPIVRTISGATQDFGQQFSQYQLSALLSPGLYRMDITVTDALNGKVSVSSSAFNQSFTASITPAPKSIRAMM